MITLTQDQKESYEKIKICYICKKRFTQKYAKDKNYRKVRDHRHYTGKYRGDAHSICDLRNNIHIKIPVFFHYGSNYDYHFIIKELTNEFEGDFD